MRTCVIEMSNPELYIYIYIYIYIHIYVHIYIYTHFFLQIFRFLYEIFYSVYGSNILQEDILIAIIKSKLNEIKM